MASIETIVTQAPQPYEMFVPQETSPLPQIVRTTYRRPEQPASSRPVLICGGWSASQRAMEGAAVELVSAGREVITYEQTPDLICGAIEGFSIHHSRKAATALTALRQHGVTSADVVAYSDGAINALLAASMWPELFSNIVLMKPAGLVGPKSFLYFLGNSAMCAKDDIRRIHRRPASVLAAYDSLRYVAQSPKRAVSEVRDISVTEVEELILQVQALGVRVGVVLANKDNFFKPDEVVRRVIDRVDALTFINSRRASHTEAVLNPGLAMEAARQMLDELENRRKYCIARQSVI